MDKIKGYLKIALNKDEYPIIFRSDKKDKLRKCHEYNHLAEEMCIPLYKENSKRQTTTTICWWRCKWERFI